MYANMGIESLIYPSCLGPSAFVRCIKIFTSSHTGCLNAGGLGKGYDAERVGLLVTGASSMPCTHHLEVNWIILR